MPMINKEISSWVLEQCGSVQLSPRASLRSVDRGTSSLIPSLESTSCVLCWRLYDVTWMN